MWRQTRIHGQIRSFSRAPCRGSLPRGRDFVTGDGDAGSGFRQIYFSGKSFQRAPGRKKVSLGDTLHVHCGLSGKRRLLNPWCPARPCVNVGLVQRRCWLDPEENLGATVAAIRRGARQGAQIVCLQELSARSTFAAKKSQKLGQWLQNEDAAAPRVRRGAKRPFSVRPALAWQPRAGSRRRLRLLWPQLRQAARPLLATPAPSDRWKEYWACRAC